MEADMKNRIAAAVLCSTLALPALGAPGEDFASRKEAEFMLKRAVTMLYSDEKRALDLFTSGDGGFMHKDLYVFCMGADGMLTAHPHFMGNSLKNWKDSTGKAVGMEILKVAHEGTFAEVSYMAPRPKGLKVSAVDPSLTKQVEKISFVTKVGEQVCGVGYYK
jgi:Single Cache domain 2